jgi:hypothetical protein
MITKKELLKYITKISDDKEIVFLARSKVSDNIEKVFYDTETGNIVITIGKI